MKTNKRLDAIGQRRSLIFNLILPIIIFWLVLFGLGYPPPYVDDLAFIGAAINLAQNGDFFNPWLAVWNERLLDRFYIQPPFYQYSLAGWLVLFGVNTQSFLFFQCLCYIIFSIFTALILKKYGFSKTATAFIVVCFAFWMLNAGLRQEALGFSFLAVGTWGLTKDTPLRYFWGFLFLGASIVTAPTTFPYALPFGLALVWANALPVRTRTHSYWLARMGAWMAAFLSISFLFLLCINFQLSLFLQDFGWHSSFRRPSLQTTVFDILFILRHGYGEIIYGSLFVFYLCLCLWIFWRRKRVSKNLVASIAVLNLSLAFSLFIYSRAITTSFSFFCWVGIALILDEIASSYTRYRFIIALLLTLVFGLNQSLNLVALIGTHQEPQSSYREVKNYVREHPNKSYAIDFIAARFVFDYNLPPGAIDWNFSNRAPLFGPTYLWEKPPHLIWLLSSYRAAVIPGFPDYPKVRLLGRTFNNTPSHPYRVILVE